MQKQRFAVPLVGGLDTKHTETTVIPGKLVQADNVVFSDKDTISVRAGLTDITYSSPASDTLARLWAHRGQICADGNIFNGTTPVALSENYALKPRPRWLPEITSTGISFDATTHAATTAYDYASNGTISVTAVADDNLSYSGGAPTPGVRVSILDSSGDVARIETLSMPAGVTGTVTFTRVLITASKIFIFYVADIGGTLTLYLQLYDLTAPYNSSGVATSLGALSYGIDFDAVYSAAPATAGALVVGWQQAANNMRFLSLNTSTGAILATDNVALTAGTVAANLNISMGLGGGTYRFYAFYTDTNVGANDISACISGITGNGTALAYGAGTAGATIAAAAVTTVGALTVVDAGTTMWCYYTGYDANNAAVIKKAVSTSYTVLTSVGETFVAANLAICGRATFINSDDIRMLVYQHRAATDASYVFFARFRSGGGSRYYNGDVHMMGVFNPGNSGPMYTSFASSNFRRLTGAYCTATTNSTVVLKAGDLFTLGGVNAAGFSLDRVILNDGGLGYVPVDDGTFLPSGFPTLVTRQIHEHSFSKPPQIVLTAFAGGTHLAAGTAYTFVATYMYVEANGDVVFSAPSTAASRTPGVNENGTFTVTCDTITRRSATRIALWRAISGNYYLDNIVNNIPTAVTTTVTTNGTDATVIANEPLYTNGGVLSNQPLPACRTGCAWADRIFVTDGLRIHFTHKKEVNFGYEYSIANQIAVPSDWGRVVGLAGLDDKLVIFGEKKIGYISGDFSRPIALVHNLGARWGTHKGVVVVDEGVWFQSPRGLRLLTRGMSIARREDGVEFGSEVDDLNPGVAAKPYSQTTVVNVVAACVLPSKPEVRFYMDNGTCLVLNRDWNQWSKFTNHTTTDAVAADKFYHIHDTSTIRYYDEGSSSTSQQPVGDGAARTEIPVTLKTGKLSLAGIQGFARIYEAGWTVATDDAFTASSPVSFTLTATTDEGNSTARSYTLSSQGSVEHFFALQPAYQKCSWMQLTMEFDPNSTGSTAVSRFLGRIRFVNLTLLLGLKPGLSKQNRVKY